MKKLILILIAAVMAVSCSDNLESLNQNIKDPTAVSGESLFTAAQKRLADQMTTPNVNLNNGRLWVQYLQEATYTDESNYDQVTRAIPDNHWRVMYRDVIKNLNEASQIISENNDPVTRGANVNKMAIIEILTVYAYSNLVETYGDIPYTEALDIDNLLPKYDDAFTVYKDLIERLTAAQNNLSVGGGTFSGEDRMYGGGVGDWKKFANSLKLRMGMVLADVDAGLSVSTVNSALAAGVFTSNSDNGSYSYSASGPNVNPMYDNLVASGRNDYVAGKTIVDKMNALDDPRREVYFTTTTGGDYVGGVIGGASQYGSHSHVADRIVEPTEPGVLLSYIEVEFLLAEAAARTGYNVTDAESHYVAGISASFNYWDANDLATYLAKPEVDYTSALATSPSTPEWKEVIGTQAWFALYNRTFAPYLSVRRLDYPILTKPASPESGFPVRYTYPANEQTLNSSSYDAAASAIGGDTPETKLFWDKFYTFDF